jgi:Na+/proline symporter
MRSNLFRILVFHNFDFQGAFWGLISGLFIGILRFIWEYSYATMPCQLEHLDKRPSVVRFNYLYFSVLLFIISAIVTIVVSLLTKPIPEKYVS